MQSHKFKDKWCPEVGGTFYTVTAEPKRGFYIVPKTWQDTWTDRELLYTNLVFETSQDAEQWIKKTKDFIEGLKFVPPVQKHYPTKAERGLEKMEKLKKYVPKFNPKRDQVYYTLGFAATLGYVVISRIWFGGMTDLALLKSNLVFKKKEEAETLVTTLEQIKEGVA